MAEQADRFCCRRCTECEGAEHHWLHGEVEFDETTGAPLLGAEYGCKHCDALGAPCDDCGAQPELDESPPNPCCPTCAGFGIVVIGARRG